MRFSLSTALVTLLALGTTALGAPSGVSLMPSTAMEYASMEHKPHIPRHLTNAERLARGLPLNPPVKRYKATGVGAPPSKRSATSTTTYIQAAYASAPGTVIGYVRMDPTQGRLELVSTTASADTYILPNTGPTSSNDVRSYTQAFGNTYTWACAVGENNRQVSSNPSMANGGLYSVFSLCTGSDGGSGTGQTAETSIWNIPSVPGTLTTNFRDTSGSIFVPNFYYDPSGHYFYAGESASSIPTGGDFGNGHTFTESDKIVLTWITA